jgi:hypothetical protein
MSRTDDLNPWAEENRKRAEIEHENGDFFYVVCKECGDYCETTKDAEYLEWEEEDDGEPGEARKYYLRRGYVGLCDECRQFCICGNTITEHERDTVGVCGECR